MFEKLTQTKERYKTFSSEDLKLVALTEAGLLKGARQYLDKNGYTEVVIPHIANATGSCEIISTLFKLPFFGEDKFLIQTGQLYLEALVPFLNNKVWAFGPSFRAESRVDSRHLVEFGLLELEFKGDFEKLLTIIEELFMVMMRKVCLYVLPLPTPEHLSNLKPPFERYTYEEAINIIGLNWGMDITSTDENKLLKQNNNQPFFITYFPIELKYFNMRQNPDDPRVVNSADLIVPYGGECVGAAEREYKHIRLLKRLKESSMYANLVADGGDPHSFDWYLDAYKEYKYELHSGFGMGINRITKFVLQLDDIRQSTVFPVNRESVY